jgi:hypothetical protein
MYQSRVETSLFLLTTTQEEDGNYGPENQYSEKSAFFVYGNESRLAGRNLDDTERCHFDASTTAAAKTFSIRIGITRFALSWP